jgi:hypothetical protein
MADTIVQIPAPVEVETPVPTKPRAPKPKATTKPKTTTRGKNITPKELAFELGMDPKKLRRHLREAYGTHHKAWVITPEMAKAMRAKLGKKAK